MVDNLILSIKSILRLLNIKYTSKFVEDTVLSHPDYPSLLSISDTLEKYHIETLAVKMDFEKLSEVPLPSIVQVEVNSQSLFFVLEKVLNNKVSYYDDKNKLIETSKEEFINLWTGICLLVETTEHSKEKDIEKKILNRQIQNVLKGIIITLLITWIIIRFLNSEALVDVSSTLYVISYTLLKTMGLTVGVFLLWFDADRFNPTLQNFCTGSDKKINCNAVLGSKHAILFYGTLSLSLLCFAYFFGTFVYLSINGFSISSMSIVCILSIMSIPILLMSIYYQALVIEQWCKFCIVIQIVLIGEISISFFSGFYKEPIVYGLLPLLLALFLIPILGWKLLKPLLDQEKELYIHKRGLKKIKSNADVFESLLVKTKKIGTPIKGLGISLNNTSAKFQVVKVCNPYCRPCAKAHPILENLVAAGSINLQILFTAASSEDKKGKIVSHFLAIDGHEDKTKIQQALNDWYLMDQKDYKSFAKKHPMNGKIKQQSKKIEAMRQWCKAEKITHTPTIFINGYELPKVYSIRDLQKILK